MFKSNLSKLIWREYQKLMRTISHISAEDFFIKKYEFTNGKVSSANLISYQIGWENMLINWYENGIQNIDFTMPGEGFDKWDYVAIAQHFYKKYENLSQNDLLEEFLYEKSKSGEVALVST